MGLNIKEVTEKLMRPRRMWPSSRLESLLRSFSPGERLVLYVLSAFLAASTLALVAGVNASVSVVEPARGGTLSEGIVGPPRFINPVLAISQADEDITALVYSGLMKAGPDGIIVPSLAEKYEISEDGTVYTFKLREDSTFHDGEPVTSGDVLFTIQAAQNPDIKSPRRADWEGVAITAPDERTVIFTLPHAYAPFLENTTIGILPKHLWNTVSVEEFPFNPLNTHPVGSGPFRFIASQSDSTGAATSYSLSAFDQFVLGNPYLRRITFRFYPNENSLVSAYNAGEVDALSSISPAALSTLMRNDANIMHVPLPRVFGVFFNQGHAPILADSSVRAALDAAIDKDALVNTILAGYGIPLENPIPPGVLNDTEKIESNTHIVSDSAQNARDILLRGGWNFDEQTKMWMKKGKTGSSGKQELTFSLATADSPELSATAEALVDAWRAAGINVNVRVYSLSELNTSIIRPRAYDAILFGEVVGRTADLFAFWHSSQRNDPGLNLAMYTNARVDTILATARATTDRKEREKLYQSFASIIAKDQPAIFLYSPEFIYVVPKALKGVELGALTSPAERFLNAGKWYMDTERVWNFFARDISTEIKDL
ncbi:MAG TPA: ABC transporter substrate-binding protein [Candidatus Paceibacterota bacterium]